MILRHCIRSGLLLVLTASIVPAQEGSFARAERLLEATPTTAPIRMDGRLDEAAWATARVLTGFRQVEPRQGEPSRHHTEVRVLYDATNLYVGFLAHDSLGRAGVRVRDLRRDFDSRNNDFVGLIVDPFGDGRTAVGMEATAWGAMQDYQVFDGDGSTRNEAWDGQWQVRTHLREDGWSAELVIPWRMLRYPGGADRWRVNFFRRSRRDNEISAWGDWPRALDASRLEFGGSLGNLRPPASGRDLRIRPFVSGSDRAPRGGSGTPDVTRGQVGGEVLWAPTPNALVEATVNTDFAQADVDNEVVNLSRFSVFFPERRQFFLEAASLFDVVPTGGIGARFGVSDDLQVRPFFSRRIGLSSEGGVIPVRGGIRFVRQASSGSLGALVMHQGGGSAEASTFGVMRVSRPVGDVGRFGAMVAARHDQPVRRGASSTGYVGAVDGFVRFNRTTTASGMFSATGGTGGRDPGVAASATLTYQTSTLAASLTETLVSEDFDPATGFVSRANVFLHQPTIAYDWRPSWKPRAIRRFYAFFKSNLYTDPDLASLQESSTEAYVDVLFENGALVYPDIFFITQRLTQDFSPIPGVDIPAGTYRFWRPNVSIGTDQSRKLSAEVRAYTGAF
ncbi:MAG: carbohydrate binding family 9 domain-containing protein, partial [Gemmatimonadetes bacterium]|nr:carbohydrate binding family 9 domain-containing protein [Gemmatimonadota bacterium]